MKTFAIVLFLVVSAVSSLKTDVKEKTYLVSMLKDEFLKIVECISKSLDPALCAKFTHCEKAMPYRIYDATQKCQKEHTGSEMKRCTKYEPLYKNSIIPAKIFDCVVELVKKLTPQEKEVMIKFEACAKKLKEESCKIVESHAHRHRKTQRGMHH